MLEISFALFIIVVALSLLIGFSLASLFFKKGIKFYKTIAYTDDLTGLLNTRAFNKQIASFWEDKKKKKESFALVLVDIDDFKSVNDTYGYQKGDKLIKEVAELLKENSRSSDWVFRYKQGDEFAFLLPETGEKGAEILLSRLNKHLQELRVQTHGKRLSITWHIEMPENKDSLKIFIQKAEKNLRTKKALVKEKPGH